MYVNIYICIYMYRERDADICSVPDICMHLYTYDTPLFLLQARTSLRRTVGSPRPSPCYIYIYNIDIEIYRERDADTCSVSDICMHLYQMNNLPTLRCSP